MAEGQTSACPTGMSPAPCTARKATDTSMFASMPGRHCSAEHDGCLNAGAQGVRCSIAVEAVSAGSQHAPGLLAMLQQSPLLRDTCATAVATAGAVSLIKVFEKLTKEGVIGQVMCLGCRPRSAAVFTCACCTLSPVCTAATQG